jgi:glycosyltransferase involved in cell wall biosynthesis
MLRPAPMKLLVFAHTPPPHHGQSYMVKLMLDGFGGDARRDPSPNSRLASLNPIRCYHVNCRYSEAFEDIGSFRPEKMWLVLRYSLEAIWCRFRYGIRAFYYVPAPGKRAALYRDWVVMLLCRPFFRHFIHHWHAVGLGDWLQREGTWFERWLTHRLLGRPALGVAVAIPSMRDALWFRSQHVEIVPNGIPDPCPDFDEVILPRRRARVRTRQRLMAGETLAESERMAAGGDPQVFHVLYLAHCTREKGLFDTLDGVAIANSELFAAGSPLRCRLTIAGAFPSEDEEAEFRRRIAQPDLEGVVDYKGFVTGPAKQQLFTESDCFCFVSLHESFGLVLVEAMAFGLPVIATSIGALLEIVPQGYPGLVPIHSAECIAKLLQEFVSADFGRNLRQHFFKHYTIAQSVDSLRIAFSAWAAATASGGKAA